MSRARRLILMSLVMLASLLMVAILIVPASDAETRGSANGSPRAEARPDEDRVKPASPAAALP